MREIISLVITTTCLAIAGVGIYFLSSKSDENTNSNQKSGKKSTLLNNDKKQIESDNYYEDDNENDYDDNDYDDNDILEESGYKSKPKAKVKSSNNKTNKTKKTTNKFTSSRKRYY
jgi:hypothetical protein